MTPYDRDHARDIAALAASRHVTAGGALPISERVQTSGRSEDTPTVLSTPADRAQAILCRGYVEGGEARRYALALWLCYSTSTPWPALDLALVLTLTETERLERVRGWSKWGVGGSASMLTATGVEFIGRAIGWYQTASAELGHSGRFGELLTAEDRAKGAIKRASDEHKRTLAAKKAKEKAA